MCPFRRLWNGMFDRHQAEMTVMQFTSHSLPVNQSVTVPWDFNPVPYCQPSSPTPMEYALPPSFEWHVWRGRRSKYNSRHLFISVARLSWMEVSFFLNQNPSIPSWPGVFQFDSVVLSEWMCIFVFCSPSSPFNSFLILLINSSFLLCSLGCHILFQNFLASFVSGYWYVFAPTSLSYC